MIICINNVLNHTYEYALFQDRVRKGVYFVPKYGENFWVFSEGKYEIKYQIWFFSKFYKYVCAP